MQLYNIRTLLYLIKINKDLQDLFTIIKEKTKIVNKKLFSNRIRIIDKLISTKYSS